MPPTVRLYQLLKIGGVQVVDVAETLVERLLCDIAPILLLRVTRRVDESVAA